MPRGPRRLLGGYCYHVINRGNARQTLFHKPDDYRAFVRLVSNACQRVSLPVLAYCVMPNHFHLVLRPEKDGDISRWMHWLTTTHVRRYHRHHQTTGHLWQDRFKAFPIEEDLHLLTVIRYVERNPLRAGLVSAAQDWRWSSLRWRNHQNRPDFLLDGPFPIPIEWESLVNQPQTESEVQALRNAIEHQSPYGSSTWIRQTEIAFR